MTVREIMERTGSKNPTLTIAWIKDAINLIQSTSAEKIKVTKRDIIKSVNSEDHIYELPADLISLVKVTIKDTSDAKYKKIKRIIQEPSYLAEDTSP